MLKICFSEHDQKLLRELYDKYESYAPIILPNVPKEVLDTFNAIRAIEDNAEQKAVEYYSSHIDELIPDIQSEIEMRLLIASQGNPKHKFMASWIRMQKLCLSPFTDLLKQQAPELYEKAMQVIDETFERRSEIIRAKKVKGAKNVTTGVGAVALRSKRPLLFTSTIDKLSQTVFDRRKNSPFYDDHVLSPLPVWVGDKGKQHVNIFVTLNTSELEKYVSLSNDVMLDPYNRAVHDAVLSLYLAGNTVFTFDMVYHYLNGYSRLVKAPEGFREALDKALTKLMRTGIQIDTKEESQLFGLEEFQYKGYLLPLTYVRAKINGQECECWKILARPPLLALAERKNQINREALSTDNANLLDTGLSTTPDNVVITHYLFNQILTMKNEHSNRNRTLLYDTLYEYLEVNAPNENALMQRKMDIRKKVKSILDAWVSSGFISGYNEVIDGRKIIGLHVQFNK